MSMFPDDWLPSQLTFEPERLVIVHVNNNNISQAVVQCFQGLQNHTSSKPKSHHLVFSLVVYRTFFWVTGPASGLAILQPDDRLMPWPGQEEVLSLDCLLVQ